MKKNKGLGEETAELIHHEDEEESIGSSVSSAPSDEEEVRKMLIKGPFHDLIILYWQHSSVNILLAQNRFNQDLIISNFSESS